MQISYADETIVEKGLFDYDNGQRPRDWNIDYSNNSFFMNAFSEAFN